MLLANHRAGRAATDSGINNPGAGYTAGSPSQFRAARSSLDSHSTSGGQRHDTRGFGFTFQVRCHVLLV